MNPFPKLAFVFVVIGQLLVLGGMIAQREYLLNTGTVVRLQCQPIDPRSLLSGDYVRLGYTISTFSDEEFARLNRDSQGFEEHDIIYVALEKNSASGFWEAAAISHELKEFKSAYPVVLRGEMRWPYNIRYGVEQYFVPQSEGLAIEREIKNASVEVVISSSGTSAIKRLFIGAQEVRFY